MTTVHQNVYLYKHIHPYKSLKKTQIVNKPQETLENAISIIPQNLPKILIEDINHGTGKDL